MGDSAASVTDGEPAESSSASIEGQLESVRLLQAAVQRLGGSTREGQVAMLERVVRTLHQGRSTLVQAGTGTGKSLAYLVPALHRAITNRERIVVSTATLALQRQIMRLDVPLVQQVFEQAGTDVPAVAVLKGRQNYVCLHKVTGGYPADDGLFEAADAAPSELGAQVTRLRTWAEGSTTGDRDDLDEAVNDRAWRQVSVTAAECIGSTCPLVSVCFSERAREEAAKADVIITNHALLGVAASGTPALGEYDAIIVDEAHELTDRVRSQAAVQLTSGSIDRLERSMRRTGKVVPGLAEASQAFRQALVGIEPGRLRGELPSLLRQALDAVRMASREAVSVSREEAKDNVTAKLAHVAAGEVHEIASRLLSDRLPQGRDVVWIQFNEFSGTTALHVSPLDVSSTIRTQLIGDKAAVMTSATMTVGGEFGHFSRSVGLGPGGFDELDVGSPFDYAKQGILYVARDLPPPGRDGTDERILERIAELVVASNGGVLGLFTSHRAAGRAAEYVRERTSTPVLLQGEDQLGRLQEQFREDFEASLFGTRSLWQGIDVPGESCRLVVIDRIPFPRPDDPVSSARSEQVAARGGNPFMEVSVADAALALAQGAGRLIRRVQDRGVVAILDPRIRTARYGPVLAQSLPRFWPTDDTALTLAALRRLAQPSDGHRIQLNP